MADGLSLIVNMYWYGNIDTTDENGNPLNGQGYLDRTLAHEFTHGLMRANIDGFDSLPLFIKEGAAELVHGIDDERPTVMENLLTNGKSTLQSVFDSGGSQSDGEIPYAAGYMFLRYLAKQGQGQQISKLDIDTNRKEIGVEINFDGSYDVSNSDAPMPTNPADIPDYFDGQGFSILCGGCYQYINITFDKSMNFGSGTLQTYSDNAYRQDYTIGLNGIDTADSNAVARAIFEGIANSSGRSKAYDVSVTKSDGTEELVCVTVDTNHHVRIAKNPKYPDSSENEYVFLKDQSPAMDFIDSGIVEATGGPNSTDDIPASSDIETLEDGTTIETITVDTDTPCGIFEAENITHQWTVRNPLVIHDGTQAGQRNYFYIKDMQTKSLTAGKIFDTDEYGIKTGDNLINESDRAHYKALSNDPDKQREWLNTLIAAENKTVDDISVTTVKDANVAIRILDGAIEYSLDNATRLGAYLQRLETDESNIVTSNENTTSAESTIRDADMAKEMTSYTKSNILAQAAQAMLAQANQNSSNVLSLLQ